jgi:hypothetical protein
MPAGCAAAAPNSAMTFNSIGLGTLQAAGSRFVPTCRPGRRLTPLTLPSARQDSTASQDSTAPAPAHEHCFSKVHHHWPMVLQLSVQPTTRMHHQAVVADVSPALTISLVPLLQAVVWERSSMQGTGPVRVSASPWPRRATTTHVGAT